MSLKSFSQIFQNDLLLSLPETFLCLSSLLLLLYGVLFLKVDKNGWQAGGTLTFSPGSKGSSLSALASRDRRRGWKDGQRGNGIGLKGWERGKASEGSDHPPLAMSLPSQPLSQLPSSGSEEKSSAQISPLLLRNVTLLTVFTFVFTLFIQWSQPVESCMFFFHSFTHDPLAFYLKTLTLLAAIATLLMSLDYFRQECMNAFESVVFIAFATLAVLLLIGSSDFLSVYLSIEFLSLSLYTLAASKRESEFSTEAGLKYFMLGAFSSGLLLFGISLLYGATGLTQFGELSIFFYNPEGAPDVVVPTQLSSPLREVTGGATLALVFIAVALLFKMTAAPFHVWAPDVYEGAPTSVTALFSMVPKIGVTAVCLRLVSLLVQGEGVQGEGVQGEGVQGGGVAPGVWEGPSTPEASVVTGIFLFAGLLSVLLGGIAGLSQRRIKRLFTFSSIGHVGYLLIALSCGSLEGYQASLLYLLVYTVITLAVFTILLCLGGGSPLRNAAPLKPAALVMGQKREENQNILAPRRRGEGLGEGLGKHGSEGPNRVRYIADFAGLGRFHPLLAISFSVALFSLAGLPPFAGFFSKVSVFFAALSSPPSLPQGWGYLVCLLAVCATCISAFYYLRLVRTLFFGGARGRGGLKKLIGPQAPSPQSAFPAVMQKQEGVGRKWEEVGSGGGSQALLPLDPSVPPVVIDRYKSALLSFSVCFLAAFFIYPSPFVMMTYKIALSLGV